MRITAQKQSLATKDETIKKLFQLVKTLSSKQASLNQNNADLYSSNNAENVIIINWLLYSCLLKISKREFIALKM